MRRQFFSFFMPLLHLQLYSGLCLSASRALRHSSLPSALMLPSFPVIHCLIVRYLVLHPGSFKHSSLAPTQSVRLAAANADFSADSTTSVRGNMLSLTRPFTPHLQAYDVNDLQSNFPKLTAIFMRLLHICVQRINHIQSALKIKPQTDLSFFSFFFFFISIQSALKNKDSGLTGH